MSTLATIFSGETDTADVFYLIGVILAALGGIVHLARPALGSIAAALVAFGIACIGFGLLLL